MIVESPLGSEALPASPVGIDGGLSSRPRHPDIHLFDTELGPHLFLVNGSQVYGLGTNELSHLSRLQDQAPDQMEAALQEFGLHTQAFIDDTPVTSPPIRAL